MCAFYSIYPMVIARIQQLLEGGRSDVGTGVLNEKFKIL